MGDAQDTKPDFCGSQKIIFQAVNEFLALASQAEISRQRVAGAALRRAERSDQPRDCGCRSDPGSKPKVAGRIMRHSYDASNTSDGRNMFEAAIRTRRPRKGA
jgi:hypothetical protein